MMFLMRFLILIEVLALDLIEIFLRSQFWNNLIEILNEKNKIFLLRVIKLIC